MSLRRALPLIAFALGLVGLVAAAVLILVPGAQQTATSSVGGPFTLTTQDGKRVTERDFTGSAHLVFFGFTHCPDICPTTLGEFAAYMEALGPDADRLHWLFITVDSERDTPEHLARYMELFDPRVVALTGTEAQVAQAARNFRVTYRRVPLDGGGYTIDHSASTFLLDAQGRFAGTIDFKEPDHIAIEKLRLLLRRPAT